MGFAVSPFDTLGLPETATAAEVETRWRTLRAELHPDKGGDADQFHEAQKAYTKALAIANEPKICEPCGGAGKVTVARGFNQVKLPCEACGGSGERS